MSRAQIGLPYQPRRKSVAPQTTARAATPQGAAEPAPAAVAALDAKFDQLMFAIQDISTKQDNVIEALYAPVVARDANDELIGVARRTK